jgi:Ca-activated chloride channel family protein
MNASCAPVALLVAAAVIGGPIVAGQAVPQTVPMMRDARTLRSSVELIVVTATVLDENGRLVTGLPREAFEIYEDAEHQTITQFSRDRVPVGLGLLLDISDSMYGPRIRDARAAVEQFLLERLAPTDSLFIMAFNHAPRLLTTWTNDAGTVRAALDTLRPSGGTSIYDTIIRALPLMDQRAPERAALVLISDGADTASDASLRDVRSALLRTDAFVYAVAIDSPVRQPINTRVNAEALGEITNPSGGHTEVVRDTGDLTAATARIADELNSQYLLGYSSPHPGDGKFHSIRVKVSAPGYRVRARTGYVAARR